MDFTKQRELMAKMELELDILEAWIATNIWLGECRMVKVKNGGMENYFCLYQRNMQKDSRTIDQKIKAIKVLFKNMRVSDKKWEVKRRLDNLAEIRINFLKEAKKNWEAL